MLAGALLLAGPHPQLASASCLVVACLPTAMTVTLAPGQASSDVFVGSWLNVTATFTGGGGVAHGIGGAWVSIRAGQAVRAAVTSFVPDTASVSFAYRVLGADIPNNAATPLSLMTVTVVNDAADARNVTATPTAQSGLNASSPQLWSKCGANCVLNQFKYIYAAKYTGYTPPTGSCTYAVGANAAGVTSWTFNFAYPFATYGIVDASGRMYALGTPCAYASLGTSGLVMGTYGALDTPPFIPCANKNCGPYNPTSGPAAGPAASQCIARPENGAYAAKVGSAACTTVGPYTPPWWHIAWQYVGTTSGAIPLGAYGAPTSVTFVPNATTDPYSAAPGLILTYDAGFNSCAVNLHRFSVLHLVCGPDGLPSMIGEGPVCRYHFLWVTRQACRVCPAATFRQSNKNLCTACAAGTASSGDGAVGACPQCAAGTLAGSAGLTACTPCASGAVSPPGAAACTPCDPGTYVSVVGVSCAPCAPGTMSAAPGLASPCTTPCPAGSYCPSGSVNASQHPCPRGSWCGAGASVPTPCAAGSFGAVTSLSTPPCSGLCAAGTYCVAGSAVNGTAPCPAGFFCPAGSGPTGSACAAGRYGATLGLESCALCPSGFYCASPATQVPVPCAAGRFGTTGLTSSGCSGACPPGFWCPLNSTAGVPCVAATSCPVAGSADPFAEVPCSAGWYALAGSASCSQCPPGRFGIAASPSAACGGPCREGYFCGAGATVDTQNFCTPGYYCPAAAGAPMGCPAGSVCASMRMAAPVPCAARTFCPMNNTLSNTQACPAGFICGVGTVTPTPCAPGYFCPLGTSPADVLNASSRLVCPLGSTCPGGSAQAVACGGGLFCNATGLVVGFPCPVGAFCELGAVFPTPCTPGRYGDATQLSLSTCSGACAQGYWCGLGSTNSTSQACPRGSYCRSGSGSPTPCDVGSYCPQAWMGTPLGCVSGFYCGAAGLASFSGACMPGTFCGPGSAAPAPCPPGFFCGSGSLGAPSGACGAGSFCPGRSASATACSAGAYCNGTGLAAPSGVCPAAFVCPAGSALPLPCPPGYYAGAANISIGTPCPIGFRCSVGSSAPAPCTGGTYCPNVAMMNGITCTRGFFCPPGAANMTLCTAGSYCGTDGLSAVTGACGAGRSCPAGSASEVPCDEGFYCFDGARIPCPPGQLCPSNSVEPSACPEGCWCSGGVSHGACRAGFVCPVNSTAEVACPPGFVCDLAGLAQPSRACPAGFMCEGGTVVPAQCSPGTFCPAGSAVETVCPSARLCDAGASVPSSCPAGYFCGPKTSSTTVAACPAGRVCTRNSASPLPCPGGRLCATSGLASPSSVCPPGRVCAENSTVSQPCAVGSYCLAGSATPSGSCAPGTFCPVNSSAPATCPVGFFCNASALGAPSGACPAAQFCGPGSALPGACPPGFVCASPGTLAPARCPGGSACPTNTSVPALCARDSFCPSGSAAPTPCGGLVGVCPVAGMAFAVPLLTGLATNAPAALTTAGGEALLVTLAAPLAGDAPQPLLRYGARPYEFTAVTAPVATGDARIAAQTVAGCGGAQTWVVSWGGLASPLAPGVPAGALNTSYGPPTIARATLNGSLDAPLATSGGVRVTLEGSNFGPAALDAVSDVYLWPKAYGLGYARPMSDCHVTIDHVQVSCLSPPLAGDEFRFSLAIGGQVTVEHSMRGTRPNVTAVVVVATPSNESAAGGGSAPCRDERALCTGAGGQSLLVSGDSFGPLNWSDSSITLSAALAPGSIEFGALGGSPPPSFVSASCAVVAPQSRVLCAGVPGFGGALAWTLSVLGLPSQPLLTGGAAYGAPSVSPTPPLVGALCDGTGMLLVHGANFGAAHAALGITLAYVDGEPAPSTTVVSDALLSVGIPPGVGGGHSLAVRVAGRASGAVSLAYAGPIVTRAVLADEEQRSGFLVDIEGRNFGTRPLLAAAGVPLVVTVGGVPCQEAAGYPHTDGGLRCWTGAEKGALVVTVGGVASAPVPFDIAVVPVLSGLAPGPPPDMAGGGVLTLQGSNLDAASALVLVNAPNGSAAAWDPVGGCTAALALVQHGQASDFCTSVAFSANEARCTLPRARAAVLALRAVVVVRLSHGVICTASGAVVLVYGPPLVAAVSPTAVGTAGGATLSVAGRNFEEGAAVYVGGAFCPPVPSAGGAGGTSSTLLQCVLPPSVGGNETLVVTSSAFEYARVSPPPPQRVRVGFLPPAVVLVAPALAPAVGGVAVVVVGSNFGSAPRVWIGARAAVVLNVSSDHTRVAVDAPAGVGALLDVVVSGGGVNVSAVGALSYARPLVVGVSSNGAPRIDAARGGVVAISGANFGPAWADAPVVALTSSGASVASVIVCRVTAFSDSEIACLTPGALTVGRLLVTVTAGGQGGWGEVSAGCGAGRVGQVGEQCVPCPAGGVCVGGLAEPVAAAGFFWVAARTFVPCTPSDACLAMPLPSMNETTPEGALQASNCAPAYQGNQCNGCVEAHYREGHACLPCPNKSWVLMVAFGFVLVALGALGAYMHRKQYNLKGLVIGIDFLQVLVMFGQFNFAWPYQVKVALEYTSVAALSLDATKPECTFRLSYLQKWTGFQLLPVAAAALVLSGSLYIVAAHVFRQRCSPTRKLPAADTGTAASALRDALNFFIGGM